MIKKTTLLRLLIICIGHISLNVVSQNFSIVNTTFKGGETGAYTHSSRALDFANNTATLGQYGGWTEVQLTATGHFRTELYNGKWYLVDPEGYLYFGAGINSVATQADYPSLNLPEDIETAGFNHLANWSEYADINSGTEKIPYTFRELFMQAYKNESQTNKDLWANGIIPVFDADFITYADNIAQTVALNKNDPYCIGVFSDNEMPIYSNTTYGELLDRYLAITDKTNENYLAANDWMISRKGAGYTIDATDREEFHGYLMKTYYSIVYSAIKKYAPNMLYLGSRLHGAAKNYNVIFKESSPYIDVFSVNYYGPYQPDTSLLEMWEAESAKPFLISEFYAKAYDVGLSNDQGAGYDVPTQTDRALYFENFVINLLESKGCLGYQWFRFQDDSSNKGVINADDEWYTELKSSIIKLNKDIYNLRSYLVELKEAEEENSVAVMEDTYVRGGSYANNNYDGEILRVKQSPTDDNYSRQALLKFDISGYNSINSAILKIKGSQSSGSVFNVTVYGLDDDSWNEATVTWNTMPTATDAIGTFSTIKTASNSSFTDLEIDITSFVQEQFSGDKIVSLNLQDADLTNEQLRIQDKDSENEPAYLYISGTTLNNEKFVKSSFSLFPNPVQNKFKIVNTNAKIQSVKVFSINGNELLSKNNINSNEINLDVSSLSNGVYFVQITDYQEKNSVKKLIKQ